MSSASSSPLGIVTILFYWSFVLGAALSDLTIFGSHSSSLPVIITRTLTFTLTLSVVGCTDIRGYPHFRIVLIMPQTTQPLANSILT